MCRKLIFLTFLLVMGFVFAFAFSTTAVASDIAISTQAGWFGQDAADREMQEIVDNVTAVSVEQFTADDQDALADWVVAHTGDGVSDLLILCGQFPDTIYASGNAQADDSLAELFLDDGNTIVNTGDYLFYVVNSSGANGTGGLETMMDIAGITMWDDNTPVVVTVEGNAVAPSLKDFQTDRPFHLDELEGDWVPELILAQNDAGTRADPVIVLNTATGGRLGIFYQTASQDDDPRGEVISEWINNYVLTGGEISNSPAWKPNPEDGAIDADVTLLEWAAGYGAVSHKVYLSADETIEESELIAETEMALIAVTLDPGVTYYWRVDDVDADGIVIEGAVWSFLTLALEAHFPSPDDLATWVPLDAQLSWTAGKDAIMHDVYFSTDEAAVAAADPGTFQGKLMDTSFDPGALESNTTYFWKVDEFALGVTNPGPVWSFTTMDLDVASDPDPADGAVDVADSVTLSWAAGETAATHDVYLSTDADALGDAVTVAEAMFTPDATLDWDTTYYWAVDVNTADGVMHPAHDVWSFKVADFLIIDDSQTTLDYDNSADPFVTEAMWETPADLTINGVRNLSFQFQGEAPPEPPEGSVSLDADTGTYSITGSGADVWGSSDQFHYGYRMLTGDGEIVARVVSNGEGSNSWAKGGVMIRETLDADSKHMLMALTGGDGGGIGFQGRPITGDRSNSYHGDVTASPPYWVKLTREGNTITAYASADGVDWQLFEDTSPDGAQTNPIDVEMADPVLIGLFVTSHAAGEKRTYEFDNVSIVGDITDTDMNRDIGIGGGGNDPAPIYAALEDSTGAVAMVAHPDPAATNITQWKFEVPITDFEGVDLTDVVKLTIGVGDGEPGGSGSIDIKDIRVTKPVVIMEPGDITIPGDNVKGVPDDGDWPGGEHPALSIDDDTGTKYLHFKGEEQPTGIQVTPSAKQVVNGITFTTANDAVERDPTSFELYGSNEGIDGPYELIASGEIVDFNDPNTAWPRFTMNTTPITFDNDMVYAHYQVLFPTVRDAASANSMQIAEIELITDIPVLDNGDTLDAWDHDNSVDKWDGSAPGEGNPGGVAALTEDDVTYVRVQDTGDPRDYGDSVPTGKTNYSLYLTQPINNGLDGARIELRVRIATTGTLDAWRKDGGGLSSTGLSDWPAGGRGGSFENGTHEDYGRGNIDIAEKGVGVIAFAPSTSGLMVGNSGNKVSVDDAAQWNTYVINIAANGDGKYTVSVSANGKLAESFTVTPGTGTVESGAYIAIGSPDLAGKVATAFDVDYISVTK